MSEIETSSPVAWPTTGVVAAAFGVGAIVLALLVALSHPRDRAARLLELDRRIGRIEALRASPAAHAYPRGVACTDTPVREAARLTSDLEGLAHQASAPLFKVSSAPLAPATDPHFSPVQFSLEMNAGYSGVIDAMRRLSTYSPAILVDRADIVPKGSFVSFRLAGRVLCRT